MHPRDQRLQRRHLFVGLGQQLVPYGVPPGKAPGHCRRLIECVANGERILSGLVAVALLDAAANFCHGPAQDLEDLDGLLLGGFGAAAAS